MQHCQTYLHLLGEGVKICARTKHFLYWITWYLCPTKPTAKENSSNIIVIFNQNTSSCVHCIYPNPAITLCIELTTQPDTLEYYYMHTLLNCKFYENGNHDMPILHDSLPHSSEFNVSTCKFTKNQAQLNIFSYNNNNNIQEFPGVTLILAWYTFWIYSSTH